MLKLQNGTLIKHEVTTINNLRALETIQIEHDLVPAEAATSIGHDDDELDHLPLDRWLIAGGVAFLLVLGVVGGIVLVM